MTVFETKVQKYNSRLMLDLGIDRIQAAGIWGNIGTETGGFTALQEKAPTIKSSRGGYGWMQWTGPRRKKYEQWCKDHNMDYASDEANYQYLVFETKTDELHSLVQLKKTTTLEAATETFMAQNLRPGVKNLKSRTDYAHQAYNITASSAKADKTGAVLVGPAAGGLVAASTTPHHYWPWIILGTVVTIIIGLVWVNKHHEAEAAQAKLELPPAKKGKK